MKDILTNTNTKYENKNLKAPIRREPNIQIRPDQVCQSGPNPGNVWEIICCKATSVASSVTGPKSSVIVHICLDSLDRVCVTASKNLVALDT